MMVLLLRRDYLVNNSLICLSILLKISVSYLKQGSRENHPSLKLLLCLLSRFKLVAADPILQGFLQTDRDGNPKGIIALDPRELLTRLL